MRDFKCNECGHHFDEPRLVQHTYREVYEGPTHVQEVESCPLCWSSNIAYTQRHTGEDEVFLVSKEHAHLLSIPTGNETECYDCHGVHTGSATKCEQCGSTNLGPIKMEVPNE